ncbi:site-2 protease family protein [Candidatus Woesearchaeota archaeon]|nr:site-2 protease family protein [Candidatus Woesearchaeota archaeon]
MPFDFLSGLLQFVLRHKIVVGFYLLIAVLLFVYRKRFQFQLKFIALYRTTWGLGLMERIATRYRELVKLLGYVGIGVGFLSMFIILFTLIQSVFTLITVPNSPSPLSPVLPGVRIPGVPEGFFVPFVQGIIAIFIIAVVHEFSHGVVALAHGVKVKSSGPAIIGPIFAAFVEPDEQQLKKKPDVVNYSLFAAGTFSNVVLAFVALFLLSAVFSPVSSAFFPEQGVVLKGVEAGLPAGAAGLRQGMAVTAINGQPIASTNDALNALQLVRPNQTAVFSTGSGDFHVVAASNSKYPGRGYFGITIEPLLKNRDTPYFGVFSWLQGILALLATLSFGIGLANMIPIGPIDGGKMLHLALTRIRGEQKANKTFGRLSLLLLLVILFLLSPIFRAILKSVAGIF